MLLFWLGSSAFACSPNSTLYGFADWVDGAVGLPTDGRVVVETGPHFPLTFTRLDTGEIVDGVPTLGLPHLKAFSDDVTYAPATLLAPGVAYRADVTDFNGHTDTATFTTGAGPTSTRFAPPVLSPLSTIGWGRDGAGITCVTDGSDLSRTVSADAEVPDGLPVGTYIAIRSPWSAENQGYFEHLALAADTTLDVAHYERPETPPGLLALHDCLTPVLILPSGHEIAGVEVCIAPPPEPELEDNAGDTAVDLAADSAGEPPGEKGGGCANQGGGGSWALTVLALVLARRRRG